MFCVDIAAALCIQFEVAKGFLRGLCRGGLLSTGLSGTSDLIANLKLRSLKVLMRYVFF